MYLVPKINIAKWNLAIINFIIYTCACELSKYLQWRCPMIANSVNMPPCILFAGLYMKILPFIIFGIFSIMAAAIGMLLPDTRNCKLPDLLSETKPLKRYETVCVNVQKIINANISTRLLILNNMKVSHFCSSSLCFNQSFCVFKLLLCKGNSSSGRWGTPESLIYSVICWNRSAIKKKKCSDLKTKAQYLFSMYCWEIMLFMSKSLKPSPGLSN